MSNLKIIFAARIDSRRIQDKSVNYLEGFQPTRSVCTIDGQHIVGGRELLEEEVISSLVSEEKIVIVGSPSITELEEFHTVSVFREKIG